MNWTGPNDAPLSTSRDRMAGIEELIDSLDLNTEKGRDLHGILHSRNIERARNMFDPWAKFKTDTTPALASIRDQIFLALEDDRNKWKSRTKAATIIGAVGWFWFFVLLLR